MRVALACPYAWDAPGGVQVHVRALARQLRTNGHDVLVLAPARASSTEVTVVGRPLRVPYQGTGAPICFSASSARVIARALGEFAPDVVHAHEPLTPSTGLLATLRSRAPVVATFHAYAERSALFTAAAPVLRPVWRRVAVRVAVSEAAAGFVRQRMGDGIRIIPNGCDVDAFAGAAPEDGLPPGRRILWVNRLDKQKGFGIALEAFARVTKRVPEARLVVLGDGPDRRAVERVPPAVRGRVHLRGAVPHELVPGYLAASEVFVSPAVGQESFGMVLVEAMAAGRPVVATDIPGYREVVHHERDGLLVPPNDPAALAEALSRLLANPGLARALGERGRADAARYRWETIAGEVETAYGDALVAGGRRETPR